MKTQINKITIGLLSVAMIGFTSCNKKDAEEQTRGQLKVEMTDAPYDNSEVEAVFVTVAGVSLDGKAVENFETQTIEISAYTGGSSTVVFDDSIDVGSYNEVALEFDYKSTANGSSPGCYVLTKDGKKHDLNSSSGLKSSVSLGKAVQVTSTSAAELIVDMDLRKCIQKEGDASSNDRYEFVSKTRFESAFRTNDMSAVGHIEGELNVEREEDEVMVVYAYKEGAYSESEANLDSETQLRFLKAETSAEVNAQGKYTLAFLEEGKYELVVAKYKVISAGELQFDSTLDLMLKTNGNVGNTVTVKSETSVSVVLGLF